MRGLPILLLVTAALSATIEAEQAKTADQLSWLAGCWKLERPDGFVEEFWLAPAGGAMLGISRTIRNGAMTEHEFVAIRDDAGVLSYVARPSGQAGASFAAVTVSATEAIFENPKHDFPQRIIYRKTDAGLTARIEGTMDGKTRGVDFPYARCK